ncbi:MAG: hypothetical protein IJK93_01995, partial [Muribaculaceae bacterium]|nr:hypothetical protein [Muribaculaceae bacterium]
MSKTKKQCFWAFLISVAVFIATSGVRAYHSTVECAWAQVVAYFALTWILLDKCDNRYKKQLWMVISIILGRLLLDLGVRIFLPTTLDTAFESIIAITAILLTWLCYRERSILVTIMSIVLITVLNSVVHHAW